MKSNGIQDLCEIFYNIYFFKHPRLFIHKTYLYQNVKYSTCSDAVKYLKFIHNFSQTIDKNKVSCK